MTEDQRLDNIMERHVHRDPDNCDICFILDQWQHGGFKKEVEDNFVEKPTKEEITKFIDVFEDLCAFEGQQRFIRGYGAFEEKDLPFPEVVKTLEWLKKITDD